MATFWGILTVLTVLITLEFNTLEAWITGAIVGGLFIALAKDARAKKEVEEQHKRDEEAKRIIAQVSHADRTSPESHSGD